MASGAAARDGAGEVDVAPFDLTDLDLFASGFPDHVFTRLRAGAPVFWHPPTAHTPEGVGFWVVSTYEDILAVVSDAGAFSSERAPGADGGGTILQDLPYGLGPGVLLNMMDDPLHHEIRRLITPAFAPRALAVMEVELRARARAIVDAVAVRGSCDFLMDVAVELPLQAVAALLGVPDADRHDLLAWSNATLDYEGRELGETNDRARDAAAAMAAYASDFVAGRKRAPGEDLLSTVLAATVTDDRDVDRPLSDVELLALFNLLIVAGSETTRNSIALGMVALVEHPDQLRALRDDRSLMATAVDEILRWTSATTYNRRTATRDVELVGHPVGARGGSGTASPQACTIRAGDKVTLWWPSANRDESQFDEPFRFDIRRTPNNHLTFGYRSHFCPGANLARLEIRVMLDEVLDRLDDFALTGPVERVRTNKHAGVWHVPMAFRAR